ncbi:sulfotransferase [Sinorhizobium psoraleae]|uniref:Sulfotransferase n=1 Tax=Sinorhizobium psoraleae TaxID=520838 RepID=A0ABT4KQL7_9HYPH|nr:sulfotransferase [Sinorhizobium psoraleae]MCZ4093177.1 sulfotransferase [Sinorhizobium psoraleae]
MTYPAAPPEPFAILGMPRTGTHYLEALLNEHPNVLSNGELLNPYDANWPDKDRLLRSDRELLELAYLHCTARKEKVTHVGCKINEPQFKERPGFLCELARWPGLKVILVARKNTLESLRSLVQARRSGHWLKFSSDKDMAPPPRVRLSIAECETYFKTTEDFHAQVQSSFAYSNTLTIEYEGLLGDPAGHLATICDFLGVAPLQHSGEVLIKRQEQRSLNETLENFHELRVHFAEGPYARFFEVSNILERPR